MMRFMIAVSLFTVPFLHLTCLLNSVTEHTMLFHRVSYYSEAHACFSHNFHCGHNSATYLFSVSAQIVGRLFRCLAFRANLIHCDRFLTNQFLLFSVKFRSLSQSFYSLASHNDSIRGCTFPYQIGSVVYFPLHNISWQCLSIASHQCFSVSEYLVREPSP